MKYIAPIFAILGMLLTAFHGPTTDFITGHPAVSGVLSGLAVLLASFAPQPHV